MKQVIIIILLAIASFFIFPKQSNKNKEDVLESKLQLSVLVSGEVKSEGVYIINDESMSTLLQQIELTEEANCNCIDLNRTLYHEDEVFIPNKNELNISLNKATAEELMRVKGIGKVISSRIIEHRLITPFTSIEQIMDVKGIGYKTYLKIRGALCL